MMTPCANPLDLSPAAYARVVLQTRWRYEAGLGARLFQYGSRENHVVSASSGLDRALLDAALRFESSNYIAHHTWAAFLRGNIVLVAPGPGSIGGASARDLYHRFERWFLRRNPDAIGAPSQTMFGAYLNFSDFEKAIKAGRVVYPRLRLKEDPYA